MNNSATSKDSRRVETSSPVEEIDDNALPLTSPLLVTLVAPPVILVNLC